ncbi:MAG: apolipoprotein N-acyltransferase, partial [Ignavibacteriaceae bacterium]
MKLFKRKNRVELSAKEKEIRKKERYLLILSGVLFGISFTPFPFPFTLFLFIAFVPYFFVITKRQSLADVNKASYLTFFVMSVTT